MNIGYWKFRLADMTRSYPNFLKKSLWSEVIRWIVRLLVRTTSFYEIPPPFWFRRVYDKVESEKSVWWAIPFCWPIEILFILQWKWGFLRSGPSLIEELVKREIEKTNAEGL